MKVFLVCKKKVFSIAFFLFLIEICCVCGMGKSAKALDSYYYNTSTKTLTVRRGEIWRNGSYLAVANERAALRSEIKKIVISRQAGSTVTLRNAQVFSGLSNLKSIEGLSDISSLHIYTDWSGMFSGDTSLQSVDMSGVNASNVTDMSSMFSGDTSLEKVNISGVNTSNVTNMSSMFWGCNSLERILIGDGFDTSNVTNMSAMFSGCGKLSYLSSDAPKVSGYFHLSCLDTSSVTNMARMFANRTEVQSMKVSGFDTSKVTNMSQLFQNCENLESLTLTGLDTSGVTNISSMFASCTNLKTLSVSNLNTSNVTDMSKMFADCEKIETLDLRSFSLLKEPNTANMFMNCDFLSTITFGSAFSVSEEMCLNNQIGWHIYHAYNPDDPDESEDITVVSGTGTYAVIKAPASVTTYTTIEYCTYLFDLQIMKNSEKRYINSKTFRKGDAVTVSINRIDHNLLGWYLEPEYINEYSLGQPAEHNMTLYAKWDKYEYKIVFDGNGSTGGEMGELEFLNDETKNLTQNAFSRTDYTFAGWSTEPDASTVLYEDEAEVSNLTRVDRSVITLYAIWNSDTSTGKVTYDYTTNGGTSATKTEDSIHTGDVIDLTPTAEKEGWEFVGWNTDKNATTGLEVLPMGRTDVVLYAIYKRNFQLDFFSGSVGEKETRTVTLYNKDIGNNVVIPALKEMTGWSAVGWEKEADSYVGSTGEGETVFLSDNTVFYGVYKKAVTLQYQSEEGEEIANSAVKWRLANVHDAITYKFPTVILSDGPDKEGYTFDGWHKGSIVGDIVQTGESILLENDMICYASYTELPKPADENGDSVGDGNSDSSGGGNSGSSGGGNSSSSGGGNSSSSGDGNSGSSGGGNSSSSGGGDSSSSGGGNSSSSGGGNSSSSGGGNSSSSGGGNSSFSDGGNSSSSDGGNNDSSSGGSTANAGNTSGGGISGGGAVGDEASGGNMPTSEPTSEPTNVPNRDATPDAAESPNPSEQIEETPSSVIVPSPTSSSQPDLSAEVKHRNNIKINLGFQVTVHTKKITVKWGKVNGADQYVIRIARCGSKFNKKNNSVVEGNRFSTTIRSLDGKKINTRQIFKIYVAAFQMNNGKRICLGKTIVGHVVGLKNKIYTNVKRIKLKKSRYTLKRKQSISIKARTILVNKKKRQLSDAHAKEFRYDTSDNTVAIVSKKGKIKAKNKGICYIYVYARNGCAKRIRVEVK